MSVTHVAANPSQITAAMRRAVYLNPNELIDNPRNLRTDIGDLDDLKASIEVVGILCPLIVIPVNAEAAEGAELWQIIIGHRRKYAAIDLALEEVPCWIAADEGAALQIVAQLAENGHRVNLTATEEAEAYYQLTLLEWTPERIASVRAIPAATVRKTLQLRELPEAARSAADAGTLTLDDAAKMAEFAEEPAAMARIVKAAGSGGWGFAHAIASERSKRDFSTAKERARAQLIVAGVKVTGKPKGFPYDGTAAPAKSLLDAHGNPVDPDQVKDLPGFAAYVEKVGDQARPVVYCTDPAKYGYTKAAPAGHGPVLSQQQRAERDAAEAAHAELLAGLTVAQPVRRDFYRQAYGSARAAKKLFAGALRSAVLHDMANRSHESEGMYAALGGTTDAETLRAAGEDKLRRCLVAQWICAHEHNLTQITLDRGWGVDEDAAAWWLGQLVADGYTLSDAEAALRLQLVGTDTAVADDGAGDEPAAGEPSGTTGPQDTEDGAGQPQRAPGDTGVGIGIDIDGNADIDADLALAELAEAQSLTV